VVVDQDKTPLSRELIRALDASRYFLIKGYPPNTRELIRYLDQNRAFMGIVIPPGLMENLRADREHAIQVIIDGSDPNYAGLTRGYITSFISSFNQRQLKEYLNRQGRDTLHPPLEGRIRVWFNEDLESRNFIIPGIIAIIIMIVGALLTSLVIAREYENGTMETIRSLPLKGGEFFVGKALPYFFIALVDVLIAVLMGQILFGIVIKSSFWLMVLASALYILVALSLGLLISSVTKSQLVANQMAILLTYLPSLLLSDFVFPVINMPWILQMLTKVIPATYFIDILNGLFLRHLGLGQLWPSFGVLFIMFVFLSFCNLRVLKGEGL
jgi:ABC-2 type transport system permease protein